MSRRTKLLVFILFAVIIVLAVGIVRFYLNIPDDTGTTGDTADIAQIVDTDDEKNQIFESSSGLYGILSSSGNIMVNPEWNSLSFIGNNTCFASKMISGKSLTGCIDYEGNVTVPLIYKSITSCTIGDYVFYSAEADSDGLCVIYDSSFNPCFMRSWDSCTVSGDNLILQSGSCSYTYSYGESGFVCTYAQLSGEAVGKPFSIDISSRILLSRLDSLSLEKIAEGISGYLDFAFSGDQSNLSGITELDNYGEFSTLFPDDEKIVSKNLMSISDIYIYTDRSDGDRQSFTASIVADVRIGYIDGNGDIKTLYDSYKAQLKFSSSESEITADSGSFTEKSPDYPAEVIPEAASGENPDDKSNADIPEKPEMPQESEIPPEEPSESEESITS